MDKKEMKRDASARKVKKSTWLILALVVYVSGMGIYFLPKNTEMSSTEKILTMAFAYLIVGALWYFTRRKEKLAAAREAEIKKNK